jgi:hypothetical protein
VFYCTYLFQENKSYGIKKPFAFVLWCMRSCVEHRKDICSSRNIRLVGDIDSNRKIELVSNIDSIENIKLGKDIDSVKKIELVGEIDSVRNTVLRQPAILTPLGF